MSGVNVPMSYPKPRKHVIAAIDYSACGADYDRAPLDCACGWSGLAGQYASHRLEQGQLSRHKTDLTRVFP